MANLVAERTQKNLVALANATEFAAAVAVRIAGNDVADSINGTRVSRHSARVMLQTQIGKCLVESDYK